MQWTIETTLTPGPGDNQGKGSPTEQLIEATRQYIDDNYEELTDDGRTLETLYRVRDAALFTINRSETRPVHVLLTGNGTEEFGIQMSFAEAMTRSPNAGTQEKVDAGKQRR